MCLNFLDLQQEVMHLSARTHRNTFVRWAYLAAVNGTRVHWDLLPGPTNRMSWAAVLCPIRSMDVNWSLDEGKLRRAAMTYARQGFRDVLSLPSNRGELMLPYCKGVTESLRLRLQQWVRRIVSVPRRGNVAKASTRRMRQWDGISILSAVLGMVGQMTSFSLRNLEELVDMVRISFEGTAFLESFISILNKTRIQSWEHLDRLTVTILFPPSVPSQPQDTSGDFSRWEQIRQYSSLLYKRVVASRVHFSGKGWEFLCEMAGRTLAE
eukprot:3937026-Rhodomonas_salina.1